MPWDSVVINGAGVTGGAGVSDAGVTSAASDAGVHSDATVYTAPVSHSRTFLQLDYRRRVAIGKYARHEWYMLHIDDKGVITLTPVELVQAAPAPPRRRRPLTKKPAPTAQEQETK